MVTFAMPFKKETRTCNRQKCAYPEKTTAGNIGGTSAREEWVCCYSLMLSRQDFSDSSKDVVTLFPERKV
jgi:hypothetical protein